MYLDYMFKFILNLVQNTLVYINCISTPKKVNNLEPNL